MNLVTGAAGHLGNVLVRELLRNGENVRALTMPGEDCTSIEGLPIDCVEGNILDRKSLDPAFSGVHTVFHLAGLVSLLEEHAPILHRVNVEGTCNVILAARHAGVKRMVYTSSIHALSRPPDGVTIDETLPFDIINSAGPYDRTKALASLVVQASQASDLDTVIVCPTGVIGPYDFRRSEMGEMILDWMNQKLNILVKGGFDFVDVRDVARGHILAARYGRSGETYILGGERIAVCRLRELVQSRAGVYSPALQLPGWAAMAGAWLAEYYYRLAHTRPRFTRYSLETLVSNSVISSAKAARELGYTSRALAESIADTVGWWVENRGRIRAAVRI
jgi:dihydroflavonol-4-reductase